MVYDVNNRVKVMVNANAPAGMTPANVAEFEYARDNGIPVIISRYTAPTARRVGLYSVRFEHGTNVVTLNNIPEALLHTTLKQKAGNLTRNTWNNHPRVRRATGISLLVGASLLGAAGLYSWSGRGDEVYDGALDGRRFTIRENVRQGVLGGGANVMRVKNGRDTYEFVDEDPNENSKFDWRTRFEDEEVGKGNVAARRRLLKEYLDNMDLDYIIFDRKGLDNPEKMAFSELEDAAGEELEAKAKEYYALKFWKARNKTRDNFWEPIYKELSKRKPEDRNDLRMAYRNQLFPVHSVIVHTPGLDGNTDSQKQVPVSTPSTSNQELAPVTIDVPEGNQEAQSRGNELGLRKVAEKWANQE